jgi:hypothetical protein
MSGFCLNLCLVARYGQAMVSPAEPATESLRRFVYLADQLQTRRIIRDDELKASLQIKGELNRPIRMNHHEPDEENLRSYLVDFRKFTMQREPVFMNRVFGIAYRHITSDEFVHHLTEARQQWKLSMTRGDIAFLVNGRTLAPEDVLDCWINGYYFHDDPAKARKLEALSRVPLTRFLFIGVLVKATQILIYAANIIKISLREGLVSEVPIRG